MRTPPEPPPQHPLPRTLRDLAPGAARLCLRVRPLLVAQGLQPGEEVITAFSGGVDSTALALVMRCLGFVPVLAHLDHGLRPESAADAAHVRNVAQRMGVPWVCERCDVAALAAEARTGIEDAGRRARYAFLEDVRLGRDAGWIATGHHLDDLGEDLLLRLIRGAGWPALAGMEAVNAQRRLLRPLLLHRKVELERFVRAAGANWRDDASNALPLFRRNRVRHRILPLLEAENPAFSDAVRRLWTLARHDDDYWQAVLAGPLAEVRPLEEGLFLPRSALRDLLPAARLRLCLAVVRRLGRGQAAAEGLLKLDAALGPEGTGGSGRRFQLPGGVEIRVRREGLVFQYIDF